MQWNAANRTIKVIIKLSTIVKDREWVSVSKRKWRKKRNLCIRYHTCICVHTHTPVNNMLTCVCRPVSGNLPKMPPSVRPTTKQRSFHNNTYINNNNNNSNFVSNNNHSNDDDNNNSSDSNNNNCNNHMVVVTAEPKLNVSCSRFHLFLQFFPCLSFRLVVLCCFYQFCVCLFIFPFPFSVAVFITYKSNSLPFRTHLFYAAL